MKHEKKVVVFDMDDTLCHFSEPMEEFARTVLGLKDSTDKKEIFNVPNFLKFEEAGMMHSLPPTVVVHAFRSLEAAGFEPHVITARSWMAQPLNVTSAWFANHHLHVPMKRIHVTDIGQSKIHKALDIMSTGKEIHSVFEDNIHQIEELSKVAPWLVVVDRPWNKHLKNGPAKYGGTVSRIHPGKLDRGFE